jgi:phytoene desaturase
MYVHSHPTALVIGAGLGGIVTAARLARAGFSVKVLEKQAAPGGRCSQLIREGHRFDIGATLFLMPEVLAETYNALGENMDDHLQLHRIDPTYRIRFEDDTQLSLTSNLNAMETQLEAIEPGSFGGLLRYLAEGYESYHLCLQRFVGCNFYHFTEYFSSQNLPLLFKLKALVKHYDNVGHYFHDPHLKEAFSFQNMYLGLSPFDAPATYSLVQYTELAEGVWYPIGGIYRVIESLTRVAEEYGVNFIYNTPVKQIETAGNRATGVLLQDGSYLNEDVIVANADLPYVYSHLLPDSAEAHRLDQLKYTCSAIMFYWGVDKVYPQLDTHNVFLADDYRTSFNRIFNDHLLPDEPSFYVHAPARTDPSAAPIGQDTLMILVPVGHIDSGTNQNWDAFQTRARSAVIHRLAASTGIFDLEQHLKFEVSYTPREWLSLFNLAKGAAFGLSHNFMQVGYLRPHNRHRRYHNLYFVGSSTHPGTGLPMVLLSARLTTERILKENHMPNYVLSMKPAVAVYS